MKKIKAQTASVIATLEPVYGILFAALLLGEVPESKVIIGGSIILLTVIYKTIVPKN
ncbi:MAG: EamA family transporter [Candidatus Aenigmarchaeota archaeon]|nr:EamA family transporter [Candidatus Aenigmarchaeota archaeon]